MGWPWGPPHPVLIRRCQGRGLLLGAWLTGADPRRAGKTVTWEAGQQCGRVSAGVMLAGVTPPAPNLLCDSDDSKAQSLFKFENLPAEQGQSWELKRRGAVPRAQLQGPPPFAPVCPVTHPVPAQEPSSSPRAARPGSAQRAAERGFPRWEASPATPPCRPARASVCPVCSGYYGCPPGLSKRNNKQKVLLHTLASLGAQWGPFLQLALLLMLLLENGGKRGWGQGLL